VRTLTSPAIDGPAAAAAPVQRRTRVDSIDIARGVVMILMALDHVRDFFGAPGDPTNPAQASALLFFTRWVTHLCAPVFFLLAGTSAYLSRRRDDTSALSRFLFTRGLWLIVLELTVVRCFGYQFNFDYQVTMLIILWAIGWSMVGLSALVYLPRRGVAAVGIVLIAAHNLTDSIAPRSLGRLAALWSVLHVPGVILAAPQHIVFVAYPLIPWIGVAAVGYGLGPVFEWTAERRRKFLLRLGCALTLAFVLLRFANVYGDPVPWTAQASSGRTLLSFLNATKYPPSLLYLLMTLGPASLLLWAAEHSAPRVLRGVRVFGRVPLFYFLLHLPLIHLLATAVCYARYGDVHWMFESPRVDQFPVTRPPGWEYSLPIVYLVWAGVIAGLYPLCVWFAGVKQRHAGGWLSYL
jgi:uncharacterized membrane protein